MHGDPAVRDGGFHGHAVFLIAATGFVKELVDRADVQPPGVIGLDSVRQASGDGSGRSSLNFILAA